MENNFVNNQDPSQDNNQNFKPLELKDFSSTWETRVSKKSEFVNQSKVLAEATKETEVKNIDKKDEVINTARNLISRLQGVYGMIFAIVDEPKLLSTEQKIAKIQGLPKEFQEIKAYKKALFEYQRGIDTTQKVLDPNAYGEMATGNVGELLKNFGETTGIGQTNTKGPEDFVR